MKQGRDDQSHDGTGLAASGARDRASRAAIASVSTSVRAPSCVLVPYKAAFELRRILTTWVNNFGAFAAALVVGSCGSIVTSTDPHIAAATDSWYVACGYASYLSLCIVRQHAVTGCHAQLSLTS